MTLTAKLDYRLEDVTQRPFGNVVYPLLDVANWKVCGQMATSISWVQFDTKLLATSMALSGKHVIASEKSVLQETLECAKRSFENLDGAKVHQTTQNPHQPRGLNPLSSTRLRFQSLHFLGPIPRPCPLPRGGGGLSDGLDRRDRRYLQRSSPVPRSVRMLRRCPLSSVRGPGQGRTLGPY